MNKASIRTLTCLALLGLKRNDDDVCWRFRPENWRWAGTSNLKTFSFEKTCTSRPVEYCIPTKVSPWKPKDCTAYLLSIELRKRYLSAVIYPRRNVYMCRVAWKSNGRNVLLSTLRPLLFQCPDKTRKRVTKSPNSSTTGNNQWQYAQS